PPPSTRGRGFVVATVVAVVLAVLLGSVGVYAFLRPGGVDTAAAPPPPASVAPTNPVSPPSSSAPSSPQPPPQTGQQPGSGGQNSALSADQQAAVAAVSPGLVDIVSTIGYGGQQGAGTGIVLTSDGLVLTNHHVVAGSTSLEVTDIANGK